MQSLITPVYGTSVIDAIFNEIVLRTSNYFYFIGKADEWSDEDYPPIPIDNEYNYRKVRKAIVFLKKIQPTDVCYLARRINWTSNTVYDMYDDRLGTEVIGINILTGGSNYSNVTANAVITGDGSNANVSVIISGGQVSRVIVTEPGEGYTTANVAFYGAPGSGATGEVVLAKSSSNKTNLKECDYYVITDEFYVYKCLDNNRGTASNVKPSLTVTSPFTTADGYKWKFMYKIPEAVKNKFLSDDYVPVLTSLTGNFYSNGTILSAVVQSGGDGYTAANTSIVVNGNGYQEGNPRRITSANLVSGGNGFVTATITVQDPFVATAWSSGASVSSGTKLKYLSNIYSVQATGTTGNVGPVHLTGAAVNGTALLKFIGNTAIITSNIAGNVIANIAIVNPGFGYSFTPNVTITGNSVGNAATITLTTVATSANLVPIISNNAIVGVQIVDGGIGYTYATANVVGDGEGAKILTDLYTITGTDTLQVLSEQLAVDGSIDAIRIISNGYGYTYANASILGSGTGAAANVSISNGRIVAINIISPGSGYRDAEVVISGDGKGGSARAVISPLGGHGYNSIRELYASNVGIYSSFSKIDNKGFETVNDYRRLGIIKNIRKFTNDNLFNGSFGSACWQLSGIFNKLNFPIDTVLTQATGGSFLVIDVQDDRMIVISTNGVKPVVGTITSTANYSFSITSIDNPDVDVFSGDVLYLLNKDAFTIGNDQAVTLRTVLGF